MLPIEADEFRNLMRALCKVYNQEADALLLDAYWLALGSWSLIDFRSACSSLMQTSKFMPKPADFNELSKANRRTPGEAWLLAKQSASSCYYAGNYGPGGTSGDEVVDRVVRMIGGYAVIAMCDIEKLTFLERRFCEHYETLEDRTEKRRLPQISLSELKRLRSERET